MTPGARRLWATALVLGALLIVTYLSVRTLSTFDSAMSPGTWVLAGGLLAAELFVGVQGLGYISALWRAQRTTEAAPLISRVTGAPVTVLVTSFNESEDVIEDTLASARAMDYPDVHLYLVDDSTREECQRSARALADRYGATLVHRTIRTGYKAGAINDLLPRLTEPFLAVLDADQRPLRHWLREVVPMLEANPRVAFVQAPQIYVNLDDLPVAAGAASQQAVFYEYICDAKGASNAAFCCGSNVVFRREALMAGAPEVDGRRHYMDETSVTEDFATSFRLHATGWESVYVNRVYVVGMGPETLAAYFTQQSRWAMGTLAIFLRMLRRLVRQPRALRPMQWIEYLLSGQYYLVGLVNLMFMCASVGYLLFGIMPVRMDAGVYLALFVPYFAITMGLFFATMRMRGHGLRATWLGTVLTFGSFWVFVKAAAVALLGLKRAFGVTPKAVGGRLPLRALTPQIVPLALCAAAAAAGVTAMIRRGPDPALVVTTTWALYHAALLATLVVYFNRPAVVLPPQPLVTRVGVHAA